jgi:ubiquinone biosynthesis protein UbiJ
MKNSGLNFEKEEVLALAKCIEDKLYKATSDDTVPGTYLVDFTVEVAGTVKKGEPYEQVEAQAADPWALLSIMFGKVNTATLEAVIRESAKISKEEKEKIKRETKEIMDRITAPHKRLISGRVNAQVQCEVKARANATKVKSKKTAS